MLDRVRTQRRHHSMDDPIEVRPAPDVPIVKRLVELGLDLERGPWVAGSVPLSMAMGNDLWTGSDVDIFLPSRAAQQQMQIVLGRLGANFRGHEGSLIKYALDRRLYHLIGNAYQDSVEEVFARIDLSICRVVTNGRLLAARASSWRDIEDRKMELVGPTNGNTLKRILKYQDRGFELRS